LPNLQRKLNIKDVFMFKDSQLPILNQSIFLVDDAVTTGSTLLEAAKILKKAGVQKVFGLTLARD